MSGSLEALILTMWPQLVALVGIAWVMSRQSEKIAQLEIKMKSAFDLINELRKELYARRND